MNTVIPVGENFRQALMQAMQCTTKHMSYAVMQTRRAATFAGYPGVLPAGGFVVVRSEDVAAFQAQYSSIKVYPYE